MGKLTKKEKQELIRKRRCEDNHRKHLQMYGRTELTEAILHHEMEKALRLFSESWDVGFKDALGFSDLFFAAREGHVELVEKMLQKGADPNLENANGTTPLWGVVEGCSGRGPTTERLVAIAKLLLDAGADPDHANTLGNTLKDMSRYLAEGPVSDVICSYTPHRECAQRTN